MEGDTAVLVRRSIVHYSVPVPGLRHLNATTIHVNLAGRTAKVLAVYLSPSRALIM
jgi:hypothetical protein